MPTTLNIKQGTDQTIEVPDVKVGGVALNPAGCSVRAHVRSTQDADTTLYEWTSTGATPNATLSTGLVKLTLSAAVTAAWTWETGVFDVELIDSAGKVSRIAEGTIRVSPEVTR